MQKSFVLKQVSEPERIVMASAQATGLSCMIFLINTFILSILFNFSFSGLVVSFVLFVITQGFMIYKTIQDPFFLNVWMAGLSCKKTQNLFKMPDNHYGD